MNRNKRSWMSRRRFLAGMGVGVSAVALPFTRISNSSAQAVTPKRFITVFTPNGTIYDAWKPSGGERDFSLGKILEPLKPYRSKLLVVDGLNMQIPGAGGGHQAGAGALLTGAGLQEGDFCGGNNCSQRSGWPANHSIDQEMARTLGGVTAYPSVELGVRVRSGKQRAHISYRAIDDPLPHVDDPYATFDRLFTGVQAEASLRRRRQSVLDAVRGDLRALSKRLGTEHRPRLEAHMESLRGVEKRLAAPSTDPSCSVPGPGARLDPRAEANYPVMGRLQMDNIVTAFACDLTRVATLLWSGATSNQQFPWLNLEPVEGDNGDPTTAHHAMSHVASRARSQLIRINTWYAEQFAYLLGRLDAIPEPNGEGTLLDNTVVFWGNELSDGDTHSRRNMHFVTAGSCGDYFQTGRYLQFKDSGRYHNDLLVSFARAMGHRIETFGNADYCRGPLL